jgi:hypothetical protein
MLTRNRFLTLTLCALTIPASACILTVEDDGAGGSGGGSTSSTTTTATTTTTTTSDSSSSTDASSSGSGMPVCDDPAAAGVGEVESACNSANFPSTCDDNSVPTGIVACHAGFSVFSVLGWERFQSCLEAIDAVPAATCDEPGETDNVKACVQAMYDAACANPAADTVCDDTNDACVTGGETTFETAQCKADLVTFGLATSGQASGLQQYHDCINNNLNTPCDVLHDTCVNAVLSGG